MNASKENARQAKQHLAKLMMLRLLDRAEAAAEKFLVEFLTTAERRLPSEEAIARDKARKARYRKSPKPARAEPS